MKQSRIKKDNDDLTKRIETIKGTMNPFDKNLDKQELYDISTGKAASKKASQYLLNVSFKRGELLKNIHRRSYKIPKMFRRPYQKAMRENVWYRFG